MMPGMIMLWAGAVVDIPSGWNLCDGSMNTPDLRNKFVACAGDSYNPGDSGGADVQSHTFTANTHRHALAGGTVMQTGTGADYNTNYVAVTGTTDEADNRPQFYALCYIMKL